MCVFFPVIEDKTKLVKCIPFTESPIKGNKLENREKKANKFLNANKISIEDTVGQLFNSVSVQKLCSR